jgi:flagellar biogenesis protein FliO
MEWVLVKTVLSLACVIGLMLGVVLVLKRFVYGNRSSSSANVEITILGTKVLQPKRSIVVVKVIDKILIVGMSETGMHILSEIDGTRGDEAMVPSVNASSGARGQIGEGTRSLGVPFADYLTASLVSSLGKRNGKSNAGSPEPVGKANTATILTAGTPQPAEYHGKIPIHRRTGRSKNHHA